MTLFKIPPKKLGINKPEMQPSPVWGLAESSMAGVSGNFATDSNGSKRSSNNKHNKWEKQNKQKIKFRCRELPEVINIIKREGEHILAEADLKKKNKTQVVEKVKNTCL